MNCGGCPKYAGRAERVPVADPVRTRVLNNQASARYRCRQRHVSASIQAELERLLQYQVTLQSRQARLQFMLQAFGSGLCPWCGTSMSDIAPSTA